MRLISRSRFAVAILSVLVAGTAGPAAVTASAATPQRLCTEELITMSDGVRLHAWVSRLAPDTPRPVLHRSLTFSSARSS
jgi:hypothetical protein